MLPKSKSAVRIFFACFFTFFSSLVYSQQGKDGAKIIGTINSVVNDYTTLLVNANSGSTSILVANNTLNSGFTSALAAGDLIFIIQVQGASMGTPDDITYGNIISYQNCGNNEFAEVASVSGANTISLSCALQFDYTSSGKVVIVRVPRYSSLTVNGGSSITCPAWNGSTGGVLVIENAGTTIINGGGSIDVSGKGFRGGALRNNNSAYGVLNYRWGGFDYGGEKGEGIAGSAVDYDSQGGRYCIGAPANGGGGGNGHNAGGGGGANAGNIASYTGKGVPDISNAPWVNAWNLEAANFATSSSSGGGKGGYTFSDGNQNALTLGPNNAGWGGDQRRDNGGRGGRPLDYSTGKIFMGGGGGAGEENNAKGGAGGNGGGICFIYTYSSISGSGQILANGAAGFSTSTSNGTDGAGGGGGGGAVLLNTYGNVSGITINANGGNGGSQSVQIFTTEAEGPGGGGGGGYIALSLGGVTRNTNGGTNGTTNSNPLSEFPPNGATKGGAGINNASLNAFRILTQTMNICSSTSVTLSFTTQGNIPPGTTYSWYDQQVGGALLGTGLTYTTPVLTSSHTYYVSSCPGFSRIPLQVNITSSISASFTTNTVCAGGQTNFTASGTVGISTWSWNFGDGSPASTQQNPSHTYASGGTYNATLTVGNGSCTTSITQNVIVNNVPVANFTSSAPSSGCGPRTVQFSNSSTSASGYSWNFGDGSSPSTQTNPSHTYATNGVYTVILTATVSTCTATHSLTISVGNSPTSSFTSNNSVCQNDTVFFTNQSTGNGSAISSYDWNFGDGSPHSTSLAPAHVYSGTGTFNVRLIAYTSQCFDDTVITVTVSAAPVAGFSATNTIGCEPLNVNFSNSTTGSPIYRWNFGDGSPTSTLASPTHNYTNAGSYTVTLIATQGSCVDTIRQVNLVNVSHGPLSAFSTASVCFGDSVRFSNLSNGNGSPIISYLWNFGDGSTSTGSSPSHLYSTTGTYNVRLTTNTAGCSDDTVITVSVNAAPSNSFSSSISDGCDSAIVQFTNSSTGATSYNWTFGDGGSSTSTSPSHNYNSPGSYTVVLTAIGIGSCRTTRAILNMVNIHSTPAASFASSSTSICSNECASFSSQSSPDAITWEWIFSGGSPPSAATQSPGSVCYLSSGNFGVTLMVSNDFCENIITDSSFMNVADCSVIPKADLISSDNNLCQGACINFANLSTNSISWQWFFPGANPASSTAEHPTNICYPNQGAFNVTLIASNPAGSDSIEYSNFIQVTTPPASPNISQVGNILTSTPASQYQWYFNNTPVSGANAQQYDAMLTGDYSVSITDASGCTSSSSTIFYSPTGITETEKGILFYVYPNPANDEISVLVNCKIANNLTLSFYDILGSLVYSEQKSMLTNEEIFKFNLKNFSQGIYFLHLQAGDHKLIRPIIKQ